MKNIPIRHINQASSPSNPLESFNIRNVEDLLAGKNMNHQLHRHNFFFVLALKKGTGNHEVDFNMHKIRNNSVFFLRPGQVHQLKLNADSTGYLMEFGTDFFNPQDTLTKQLLRKASNKAYCPLTTNGFDKLLDVLSSISVEFQNKRENYYDVIKANLSIFFIELLRNRKNEDNSPRVTDPYMQERLDEFFELLETHISKCKRVSQYAKMLNLSVYQINAITRTLLGKTCSELIDEYIVLEVKRFLLATPNQVNQIAYHLGYEDVSYFIRFFKKHTGYSPEVFRMNFR